MTTVASQQTAIGKKNLYIGVGLAVLAAIIWSGNFIVARGVSARIPPFTINFFRWTTATVVMLPFAAKQVAAERSILYKSWKYFFLVSLSCIVLFNSFVYVAGHYTSVINMALIGTTSSPIFTILLAAIFFREKIKPLRIAGLALCITGILILLSQASFERLRAFHFSEGDWWILTSAFFFACYNVLVKKIPSGISPITFLFAFSLMGSVMLLPFFIWEHYHSPAFYWDAKLVGIILFLGIGTSFVAYMCWNAAILRIGSSRTSLFSNLIPVFSTIEAVIILGEKMTTIHMVSGIIVIAGLVIANLKRANPTL